MIDLTGPINDLVDTLEDAGIRSVSVDPAEINTPGVWVQFTGFEADLLGGYTISTALVCIVGDISPLRSLATLSELVDKVLTVVDPSGPITAVAVNMPGAKPLPGLRIPFDLPTCYP